MEKINQMTSNTLYVTQNALIVNQMTQNTGLYGIFGYSWKDSNIYTLGEHDPGSVQNGRTSSEI